jgi:hypothetical protein
MSTDRHRVDVPTGEDKKYIRVETFYSKGGINYSTYKTDPRGYYVTVQLIEKDTEGPFSTERFDPFEGVRYFLTDAKRLHAPTLAAIAERLKERAPEIAKLYLAGDRAALHAEITRA